MPMDHDSASPTVFDVVVVGAGFSGLYALHRLRNDLGLRVVVFEAGTGVGGTWYWNRYPGCRCDVPSYAYSFSFSPELDQEWSWTEKCAAQPEIERYLNHVADRFDLRRDIRLETRVTGARYDEATGLWDVTTDDGGITHARWFVSGAGILSAGNVPPFKGRDTFAGESYFTGQWPHHPVDLAGKRVGVIGTGSTGIQVVPVVAEQAAHLTVFQRTANYSVPSRNGPMDPEFERALKAKYPEARAKERASPVGLHEDSPTRRALDVSPEERQRVYEAAWEAGGFRLLVSTFTDLVTNREANRTISEFIAGKIRQRVRDPQVAEKLIPTHPFGTKRPALDNGYFEAFNRDNVALVDLRDTPIVEITPRGIRTSDREHPLDVIIYATGFDGFSGSLVRMDIRGRGGRRLQDHWAEGPRTALGFGTHGFPNFFMVTGPQSGVFFNVARNIEQHVDWIVDCIRYLRDHGHVAIEATPEGEARWNARVEAAANATLVPETDSWWVGANIPGKPRRILRFVGGAVAYQQACNEAAEKGYEGFELRRSERPPWCRPRS